MPRTALSLTTLPPNSAGAQSAGNAVDPTNGHILSGAGSPEEVLLDIDSTFAGAKTFTVKAGANPPATEAGKGDLVVSLNAQRRVVGPFSSARFIQADGSLWVDVEASATGTIRAYRVPRTA